MSQNTLQPKMHKVWSRWIIYAEGATTWGTMQPWQSVRTLGPLLSVWKSAIRFLHLPAELKYWLVSTFVSVFPSLTGELHHGALIKFHDLFPKDCANYPPYGVNLVSPRARGSPSWIWNFLYRHIKESSYYYCPVFCLGARTWDDAKHVLTALMVSWKRLSERKLCLSSCLANIILAFRMFARPFCVLVCTVCVCVAASLVGFVVFVCVYLIPVSLEQSLWTVNRFTANWMASQSGSFACCVCYEKILSGRNESIEPSFNRRLHGNTTVSG